MGFKGIDSKIVDTANKAKAAAAKAHHKSGNVVDQAKAGVGEMAKEVGDHVEETVEKARQGLQQMANKAVDAARQTAQKVAHAVKETTTKVEHSGHALADKASEKLKNH